MQTWYFNNFACQIYASQFTFSRFPVLWPWGWTEFSALIGCLHSSKGRRQGRPSRMRSECPRSSSTSWSSTIGTPASFSPPASTLVLSRMAGCMGCVSQTSKCKKSWKMLSFCQLKAKTFGFLDFYRDPKIRQDLIEILFRVAQIWLLSMFIASIGLPRYIYCRKMLNWQKKILKFFFADIDHYCWNSSTCQRHWVS